MIDIYGCCLSYRHPIGRITDWEFGRAKETRFDSPASEFSNRPMKKARWIRDNSDISWEKYGRNDPYFGVLTEPQFRGRTLSEDARSEFFRSGAEHFSWLKTRMSDYFGALPRGRACDFGCGVGRLLIPFAGEFDQVTGIDVSAAMLDEARRNYERLGLTNIILLRSPDLADFDQSFDFIHSCITLQHIDARRGEKIIRRLLSCLSPDGIIALQFYFHENVSRGRLMFRELRKIAPPLNWFLNSVKGNRWNDPLMQHNIYNIGNILWLLQNTGIAEAHVALAEAPGAMGNIGSAFLFARKNQMNPAGCTDATGLYPP